MMNFFSFIVLSTLFSCSVSFAFSSSHDSTALKPKPIYGQEIRVISYILDHRHYRKIKLGDSLSSAMLNSYIAQLDGNRTYFLRSDIESFESYRLLLDDKTHNADVTPAYVIYNVFSKRYFDRMDFAMKIINSDFDYSKDEYYETDRGDKPWPQSVKDMNKIWRKIIKSQALSLKLTGKSQDDIKEELHKRYSRFAKNATKFSSDEVFSIYANALTRAYDPHTNYLSPSMSELFKQSMSLSLEGIGARLQTENDYTKIVGIISGGPAHKSNEIHVNDMITGVGQEENGEIVDVIGWRTYDVVKLIKGPKGTTVRLQILPAKTGITGNTIEVLLVREKIKLEDMAAKKKVITYPTVDKIRKFGVVSLPGFYMDFEAYARGDSNYRSSTADVKKLIEELQQEGVEGIVVDLRNNGGGSLSEAIDLTGLFIKDGPVVQVRDVLNKINICMDENSDILYDGPLVIITNRFSASASEIFAGAIQDYRRGVIIGESTYGKGTVQTVIDLKRFINTKEDVGKLKITFQKFYRVTGSSTQHQGVTPDVALPSAYDGEQFGESANANALPWDIIESASFRKIVAVDDKIIADLNASYNDRILLNEGLKKYIDEIKELKENLKQTKISLNEEERRMETEKNTLAQSSEIIEKDSGENSPKNELSQLDDEYLRESLFLLYELIKRQTG